MHDRRELDLAPARATPLIGVNNRNLHTFETSLEVTLRLREAVPPDRIIEFEVDQVKEYLEGPLGEHTGYYDAMCQPQPAASATAITHRRIPIFQGLLTGKPITENHILMQVPFEVSLYSMLKRQFPTVERVSLRPSSSVSY